MESTGENVVPGGLKAGAAARWPVGCLGMIALVLGVESLVSARRARFQDVTSVTWELSARSAGGEAARCEVLGFGDSLLKFGFNPLVLERETGRSAWNLAVNAGR